MKNKGRSEQILIDMYAQRKIKNNNFFQYMLRLPHNRLHETEADKVGLELAAKVCH